MIYIPKKNYTEIEYSEEFAKTINQVILINDDKSKNTTDLFSIWNQKTNVLISSCLGDFYEYLNSKKFKANYNYLIIGGKEVGYKKIIEYKSLLEFMIYYKNERKKLSKHISSFSIKELKNKENKNIKEELNLFLNLNLSGKMLRGILISIAYKMFNKIEDDNYLDLALAYELFETSILVHDDLIDSANMRRGQDTIDEAINKKYQLDEESNIYKKDRLSHAKNMAICMGDYGFFKTYEIISANYSASILNYFSEVAKDTVKGEILDTKYPFLAKYHKKNVSYNDIIEIYEKKTSNYSIIAPFNLGFMANNVSKTNITRMTKALRGLGIAFQIKDDIMGIFGEDLKTGKSSSDILEFKQTLLYYYINKSKYKDEFLELYGNKLKQSEFNRIKEILTLSKAYEKTIADAAKYLDESREAINKIRIIPKYYKEVLNGLILYMDLRDR